MVQNGEFRTKRPKAVKALVAGNEGERRIDEAVLTLARIIGRQMAREQFQAREPHPETEVTTSSDL